MVSKFDGHAKRELIVNNSFFLKSLLMIELDVLPMYIGKMYINSLDDLTRISYSGSKSTMIDELNDFAENGKKEIAM